MCLTTMTRLVDFLADSLPADDDVVVDGGGGGGEL